MGLDNYTNVVYGWKITDHKTLKHMCEDIDYICDKVYDGKLYNEMINGYMVEDTMCGYYCYFGRILACWDCKDENSDFVLTEEKVKQGYQEYLDMCNKYPELGKLFKKYSKKMEPQIYIFQHIW